VAIEVLPDRLAIDAALAELPEEFRAPVVLRDLCDLDYAEIAEALGIPPGTVRSRIARGRALLARRLADGERTGNQPAPAGRPTPVDEPPTAP
jgi:RNA polymerase sigma-70 factor (ECF subfamily)